MKHLKCGRLSCAFLVAVALLSSGLPAETPMKFSFGSESIAGFASVPVTTSYNASKGFGFEPNSATLFSVKVPLDQDFRVTLTFGGAEPADLTVKAETRRLMVEQARAAAGQTATVSFNVNVRSRTIASGGEVKLNDRELKTYTWDDKLTLEFLGDKPCVKTLAIEPVAGLTTVYIAADSTVTDQGAEPWCGWGQMLPRFFGDKVVVANQAESGRSLRSFRAERRLDKVLSVIQPGDYLFIQFGHNDMKEKGEGVGALTTYKADLEQYVAAARGKGATPVLVTPMYRRRFSSDGKLQETLGDYPLANRQVAAEQKVALIDLHEMSDKFFSKLGPEGTLHAFVHYPANTYPGQMAELKDDTHFNNYGGYELAKCVVEAIRTSDLPLAKLLSSDVKPFDPATPDAFDAIEIPASGMPAMTTRPEGN